MGLCVLGSPGRACRVPFKYAVNRKSNLSPETSWPQIREAEALSVNDRLLPGEAQTSVRGQHREEEEEVGMLHVWFCLG